MRHEVTHMGIVHGGECFCLPGLMGRRIIGKYADNVDIVEVAELGALEIDEFASKYEMKKLFAAFILHAENSGFAVVRRVDRAAKSRSLRAE